MVRLLHRNVKKITCFPQLLGHCLHVVAAMMFPKDFTPETHASFDKFLGALTMALSENYR